MTLVPDLGNASGGSVKNNSKYLKFQNLQLILPVVFFICIIVLLHMVYITKKVPSFILPSPIHIANRFITDYAILLPNTLYTLYGAVIGIILSLIFAFIIALLLDIFPISYTILYPFILLFQMVPFVLFAPLLVLFFGYGTTTKLIVVILMCFFPILVTLLQGFRMVSSQHIQLLQTMRASVWQIYYWVKIPSAFSQLFSGLRLTVSYAMSASIISEWVSSMQGLGYIMIQSQRSFVIERVYAIMLLIFILSIGLYLFVILLEYLFVTRKNILNN